MVVTKERASCPYLLGKGQPPEVTKKGMRNRSFRSHMNHLNGKVKRTVLVSHLLANNIPVARPCEKRLSSAIRLVAASEASNRLPQPLAD